MKRKWLYIGVAAATILQFFFGQLWRGFLIVSSRGDVCPFLREPTRPVFNFLSEVAFALVVGFFYLHVPDQKRSLTSGVTIGSILGLFIGLYRFLDWYGLYAFSLSLIALEIIKTIILGMICGAAIAIAERTTNPRATLAQPD